MVDSWKLKRILRSCLGNNSLWHYIRFLLNKSEIAKVAKKFDRTIDRQLLKEMRRAWVKFHWDFSEFFYFGYEETDDVNRSSFVPEYEKNIFCDKANNHVSDLVFHDKWDTYKKFKKFFNREAVLLSDENSLCSACGFFEKHRRFILKPVNAATGRGIQIINLDSKSNYRDDLLSILCEVGPCIAEELIVQSKAMSEFHPHSVNTVRIPTFRFGDNETLIFHPFLRIGKGGHIVDNAGAGGIMGLLDVDTGVVYAAGDERCNCYTKHPDSGLDIVGFQVPRWEEAKSLVKCLAEVMPEVRYVGWDLALTDNGWVMIEGNEKGQFIWQIPTKTGFRDEFERICRKGNIRI